MMKPQIAQIPEIRKKTETQFQPCFECAQSAKSVDHRKGVICGNPFCGLMGAGYDVMNWSWSYAATPFCPKMSG